MLLWAVFMGGCSDDGGRARYSSGLASASRITDLNRGEIDQICDTYNVFVTTQVNLEAVAHIVCLPSAIFLSSNRAACETNLAGCKRLFPSNIEVGAVVRSEEACYDYLSSCDATVAALEGCVDVHLDLAFDILGNWSCSFVDDPDLRLMAGEQREAQAFGVSVCADVTDSCDRFAAIRPD